MSVATYEDIKNLGGDTLLIDVREPSELKETGSIPSSINIPMGQISEAFDVSDEEFKDRYGREKPAKDQELIFSCKLGGRAKRACETIMQKGYSNVRCYSGSWTEWAEKSKAESS